MQCGVQLPVKIIWTKWISNKCSHFLLVITCWLSNVAECCFSGNTFPKTVENANMISHEGYVLDFVPWNNSEFYVMKKSMMEFEVRVCVWEEFWGCMKGKKKHPVPYGLELASCSVAGSHIVLISEGMMLCKKPPANSLIPDILIL